MIDDFKKPTLSPRQESVLSFIKDSFDRRGFPPTVREIARHLQIRGPKGAHKHLAALEEKGFIRRRSGLSRAVEVVGWSGRTAAPTVAVPIVGRVRAGTPVLATEEIEGHLRLDRSIAPPGSFVLRIVGDSMIEAGIFEGDLAIVQPEPRPRNGTIVVALMDDEATVKRFYREVDRIRLEPANSGMAPITVRPNQKEIRIIGRVAAIIRKF